MAELRQEFALMKTQVDLMKKQGLAAYTSANANVNAVNYQGRAPGYDEYEYEEEACYMENQAAGFRTNAQGSSQDNWRQGQGNQGRNFNREGNYNREGNFNRNGFYDRNRAERDGEWGRRDNFRNDRSGAYVPPNNREGGSSGNRIEDMLGRLLKKSDTQDEMLRELKSEVSGMNQKIESHSVAIKQLEQQVTTLSVSANQRQKGTLPSNTIQNPKNDGHCMAVTTRSGKQTIDPPMPELEEIDENNAQPENQVLEPVGVTEEEKEAPRALTPIKRPPPPYPQRLKKQAEDGKFKNFLARLKHLYINLPLIEALEQMPGYAKFMKDLVTKKRTVSSETTDNIQHCGAIASRFIAQKKEDPGAFTIPCTIGTFNFAKALCDLGASINLMPLKVYQKLGLGAPTPTTMRLLMADRTVKKPVGILMDVLVRVEKFIFPADFVILDCEVDFDVPIILGRPFMATGRALVDMELGQLKLRLNDEEVVFSISQSMKQPLDMSPWTLAKSE